jgi:quinoprotein glucose dehydrogenase
MGYTRETQHDLWDLDLVGPPIILDITIQNKVIPAVIALSKTGNILFANRKNGELIFGGYYKKLPNEYKFYPSSQLEINKPSKVSKVYFDLNHDVTDISPDSRKFVLHKIRNVKDGELLPVSTDYDTLYFGHHGGAEWPGGAIDPKTSTLVVPSNLYPWILRAQFIDKKEDQTINQAIVNKVYTNKCLICHGPNLRGWRQTELEGDIFVPSLIGLTKNNKINSLSSVERFEYSHKYTQDVNKYSFPNYKNYIKDKHYKKIYKRLKFLHLSNKLREKIANFFSDKYANNSSDYISLDNFKITQSDLDILNKMFIKIDNDISKRNDFAVEPVWQMLLDQNNLPGSKPPWGFLTAINLKNGQIKWRVPFGVSINKQSGKIIEGDMNFGGAIITGSNLVFASGTRDSYARIFDLDNGRELLKLKLPAAGSSPPTTFMSKGCQYIVFTSTGGMFAGYNHSDTTVAYKLKDCRPRNN